MRRTIALLAALTAATTAVAACGGSSGGDATATTVTTATAASTTAPATTVASATVAAATTTATTPATAAPAPATTAAAAAPTTGAPATTAAGTPAGSIGPAASPVVYVESPMATRRETTDRGVLVRVSNPAFDRAFVLAMLEADLAKARLGTGWTTNVIARDPQWTPGSCGETARVFVGHRWEVFVDLPRNAVDAPDLRSVQLVSFDTQTGRMIGHLELPNRVSWLTSQLAELDDHTVGILFDPSGPTDPASTVLARRVALRRIDLRTGAATDVEMPRLPGDGVVALTFDADDRVIATVQPGPVTYRWAPGRAPEKIPEPGVLLRPIDGVDLDWERQDAAGDVPVVRVADGAVLARIHAWRFFANGPGLGLAGWSQGRGYFGGFTHDTSGPEAASTRLSPGVYDAATTTWNWVFAGDSPQDVGYFIVGTQ